MTNKEEYLKCSKCELPDCVNCLDEKDVAFRRGSYHRYDFDVAEEAKRLGISKNALYSRISRGGVEWALSGKDGRKKHD